MEFTIRRAAVSDAEAIRRIYEPYVVNTAVTFEYDVPTAEEFSERISSTLKRYPYYVAEMNGKVVGYAYAGQFHQRAACAWAAELSVYVDKSARGMCIGKTLYSYIERDLKEMGVINAYAVIAYTSENDPYLTKDSVYFHKKLGFEQVGRLNKCGYKFNRWYDLIYMEKIIGDRCKVPELDKLK